MVSWHSMICHLSILLLSAYFPPNHAKPENIRQPRVTILQGTLEGMIKNTRNHRNIFSFLGIPYARPPIGSFRFANPVAADGWEGILNATDDTRICPQIPEDEILGDEDCLYLNVHTPQLPDSENVSLLPVMVYIHGGSFITGSKSSVQVGPEYLLDKDVVLVVMNYRLGALGFLSTGDEVASGNWGHKDQVLALQWIQDNIKYFGGDPNQVTIFGESSGACSVHLLTLSDSTKGLFHRYIMQSGSAFVKWGYRPRAGYSNRAKQLGGFVGCSNDTSDSLISCLRTVNVLTIIAADSRFKVWNQLLFDIWGPTDEPDIEGAVHTDSPWNLFAAGAVRDLPSISGVVRDEGLLPAAELYADETLLEDFLENIDDLLPVVLSWTYESETILARLEDIKLYYFNKSLKPNTSELLSNFTKLVGDSGTFYPAHSALEQQYKLANGPQYFYTFNYRGTFSNSYLYSGSAENHGVCHEDDLIYLFPSEAAFSELDQTMSKTDYEMVDTMVQLWTSFAIDGTPTALGLEGIAWEPYSSKDNYLRIGEESDVGLEVHYSFFNERMQFWANIYATV